MKSNILEKKRKAKEVKPGDTVLIVEDVRDGNKATGMVGTYEGMFPIHKGFDNPRILLSDGTRIWGIECWWKVLGPGEAVELDKDQALLREYKNDLLKDIKQTRGNYEKGKL